MGVCAKTSLLYKGKFYIHCSAHSHYWYVALEGYAEGNMTLILKKATEYHTNSIITIPSLSPLNWAIPSH